MASKNYLDETGLAYFLTKLASWIPSWFPSQTGQSGKVLTTNGTSLSWTSPTGVTIDSALDSSSTNPVQNAVITNALANYLPLSGGTLTGVSYGVASALANSLLTTVDSKFASITQLSYVKLGNGLIVQWGFQSSTTDATITFPTAFTDQYSFVCLAQPRSNQVMTRNITTSQATTTRFTLSTESSFTWVAIGY